MIIRITNFEDEIFVRGVGCNTRENTTLRMIINKNVCICMYLYISRKIGLVKKLLTKVDRATL
jgi:hypothetical protein